MVNDVITVGSTGEATDGALLTGLGGAGLTTGGATTGGGAAFGGIGDTTGGATGGGTALGATVGAGIVVVEKEVTVTCGAARTDTLSAARA